MFTVSLRSKLSKIGICFARLKHASENEKLGWASFRLRDNDPSIVGAEVIELINRIFSPTRYTEIILYHASITFPKSVTVSERAGFSLTPPRCSHYALYAFLTRMNLYDIGFVFTCKSCGSKPQIKKVERPVKNLTRRFESAFIPLLFMTVGEIDCCHRDIFLSKL